MEEPLVNVEFIKSSNRFIARIQSELGGMREYSSSSFEEVLEQVVIDLQDEFESYCSVALPRRWTFLEERPHPLLLVRGRPDEAERRGLEREARGQGHLRGRAQARLRQGDRHRGLRRDLRGERLRLREQAVRGHDAVDE